jgi:hypothetical protein
MGIRTSGALQSGLRTPEVEVKPEYEASTSSVRGQEERRTKQYGCVFVFGGVEEFQIIEELKGHYKPRRSDITAT